MARSVFFMLALAVPLGCSAHETEPNVEQIGPTAALASPHAFTGRWRSVSPSLEFIRLDVYSKSSEMGVFGIRLSLSGMMWVGSGRIVGDSLVAPLMATGSMQLTRTVIVRAREGGRLSLESRAGGLGVSFVRE